MCPSVYICTTYFSPARPKQSAMLSAVIRYPLDRAGVNKTSVGGKTTRNSEKNVVTDINVEKYFVSIRISDFKDKGKAFGYVQAARMSFLQDTSYFFSLIHVAPIFFY